MSGVVGGRLLCAPSRCSLRTRRGSLMVSGGDAERRGAVVRMAAVTAGGAAGVQGLNRNGKNELLAGGPFILNLLEMDNVTMDGRCAHGCEGFLMTMDKMSRKCIQEVMKRPGHQLIDENGYLSSPFTSFSSLPRPRKHAE